jgi:prepilin-type N-terminal cleavage/methylation domain-containing protein
MRRIKQGFTLIELLVVISIIGILATLLIANYNAARSRARDAQRKSDLRNIQTALRLYYNDTQNYPCSDGHPVPTEPNETSDIRGCGTQPACSQVSPCNWGSSWAPTTSRVYMSTLPDDPSPDRSYRYDWITNDNYTLKACLENTSDDKCSLTVSETWCNTNLGGCLYIVQP